MSHGQAIDDRASGQRISCLMVTQATRLPLAATAIADFAAQTHAPRELVVVHDGDGACHEALLALADGCSSAPVRVVAAEAGLTLGALRNLAVAHATAPLVCQWDDDDRYHPRRLALQLAALEREQAAFCFLVDQLHWFVDAGALYWDDWDREPFPMNLVQGTLLGYREAMPHYPDLRRGEDTAAMLQLLRAGHRIARMRGAGWCYVYVQHGGNAWHAAHHAAISRAKALGAARLLAREAGLRARLAEYRPRITATHMPHETGALQLG